jgi:CIC family chloride channel protein
LMGLGLLVGIVGGVGAVAFRELIVGVTTVATGQSDYGLAARVPNPHVPWLGIWFVVLAPVVGGLLYGPLISRFAPEARGHGVPEVMLAVSEDGGRIRIRVAAVKALGSALCIGTGGSVGREGPIVQIGSALGSGLGQLLDLPESRVRLLVACGAAAGISATFNAPVAGVFFALELILGEFEVEAFGVVVLASVTADVIGRAAFGSQPFLTLPTFQQQSLWEYGLYAGLGVLAAVSATAFVKTLYGFEDTADAIWKGPRWLRPAVGGLLLGGLLLVLPQMYGVGYPVLRHAVGGGYALWFLIGLLVGKLVATSLTMAIGGSGGVFAPSLFMGAMLGTAYGDSISRFAPHLTGQPGAYGLVGMGAFFAAASRAPITAVLIIFELTGDYHIILPLMVAIVVATWMASKLAQDSIYTLKLRRRGIDILNRRAPALQQITVEQAMSAPPEPIPWRATLSELVDRFSAEHAACLPVADTQGYAGVITVGHLDRAVAEQRLEACADDLADDVPTLAPSQKLDAGLEHLLSEEPGGLPVLSPERDLIGWITDRDILTAYRNHLKHPDSNHISARRTNAHGTTRFPEHEANQPIAIVGAKP